MTSAAITTISRTEDERGRMTLIDRLMAKISPEPNSGCWLWMGGATNSGYGTFKKDGSMKAAHRVVYEVIRGVIPQGMELDHLCRVRCCVNPSHLEVVTHRENCQRSPILRRFHDTHNGKKTHCPAGHPYDIANTYNSGKKWQHRNCRECYRLRSIRRRAAQRGQMQ